VLELKERLGSVGEAQPATPLAPKTHLVARDALVELGYSLAEAETALAGTDPEAPPEERVRAALRKAA
jgi:Holliday junction resolvasome RuvABC DNA-binding subunit